jgi:sulfur dioxygenase
MNEFNAPQPRRLEVASPAHQRPGPEGANAPAPSYAGDVSPQLACQWWQQGDAVLIDVRTDAEREWVGFVPGAVPLPWKHWPGMALNSAFDEGIRAAVPPGKKAVLLCRSGVRSIDAAKRATQLGIEAYNILEGFEGGADEYGQRGHKGGWRFRGLPWRQG